MDLLEFLILKKVVESKYKNGKFHGKGTYTFANGDVIEGIWENGKKVELTKT